MRLSSKKPEPPETPKKKRWGCFWIALGVVACAAGILLLVYRKEAAGVAQTFRIAGAVRGFVDEKAVSLAQDFPLHPASPPGLDEDLFRRYCRARAALAAQLEPLLPKLLELRDLRVRNASERRQALVRLGPVGPGICAYVSAIEPILRENHLSVELYRWTAIQVWGQVALSASREEPSTLEFLRTGRERMQQLLREPLREVVPRQFSETVLKELGTEFVSTDAVSVWPVIQAGWTQWTQRDAAPLLDLAAIKGWDQLQQVVEKEE
jgi:hypothetical protein